MNPVNGREIVLAFNDCINRRDLDGLARLMTDAHIFIDSDGNRVAGRVAAVAA